MGFKIAHNLCVEYSRKTTMAALLHDSEEETPVMHKQAILPNTCYHESHGKIKSLINSLPDKQREVMMLNHYGGLGFNEIAGIMKCSLTNALDNMRFGLNNLRKMMKEKKCFWTDLYSWLKIEI